MCRRFSEDGYERPLEQCKNPKTYAQRTCTNDKSLFCAKRHSAQVLQHTSFGIVRKWESKPSAPPWFQLMGPDSFDPVFQVMPAQAGATSLLNGVVPGTEQSGSVSRVEPAEPHVTPVGERSYGSVEQSREPLDMLPEGTSGPDELESEQDLQQASNIAATTGESAGATLSESVAGGTGQSVHGYFTPRSMQSMVPTRGTWFAGMEMPGWVSRLGSYVSLGGTQAEFFPSPLAGSSRSSPPGGQAFVLRSPATSRPRPAVPSPPSSSSIPAEAIQAEVQRQLGGILDRLREAEARNDLLQAEIARYQTSDGARQSWSPWVNENGAAGMNSLPMPSQPGEPMAMDRGAAVGSGEGQREARSQELRSPEVPRLPQPERATVNAHERVPPPPQPMSGGYTDDRGEAPQHHPRGSLLSTLLGRARTPSPPPPQPSSESRVLDALTKGVQQLQELQLEAMNRAATPSGVVETVKPGTTSLTPLPSLKGTTSLATSALEFQDWMELTASAMADISEQSGQWWVMVQKLVSETYSRWLRATPLERLQIEPTNSEPLCSGRWIRVNARVSAMLLSAMEEELRRDIISQRLSQDTPRILFRLHTLFQPGGGAERHEMLKRLQSPSDYLNDESLEEVLKTIRAWPRWLARCQAVGMSPPDASVLVKGLAALSSKHIQSSADSAFRTAMLRTSLRLDAQPTLDQVVAYQRHLQAELETLSSAAIPQASGPKVRAVEAGSPGGAKGREKGASEACRYFLKPSGCRRGARCNYSHSMASLDRETRAKKCLLCGSEAHRQKDCGVGRPSPKSRPTSSSTTTTTPGGKPGSAEVAAVAVDASPSAPIQGVPWTLDALVQAAQQIVQSQATAASEDGDKSPEKTAPSAKVLIVKDIRISSLRAATALLDSGATHALRTAKGTDEWIEAEEVSVQLAGSHSLSMRMNKSGTLLMPPRATSTAEDRGQTIVPMGELVRTLGDTIHWSPEACELIDPEGQALKLNTSSGCPQLCEAEALALIARLEERKRERLVNETILAEDRLTRMEAAMNTSWFEYLMHYTNSGDREPGLRALRDAPFFSDIPGECLCGMIPQRLPEKGWDVLKQLDFLTRQQRRTLLASKRWVIHLCAGKESHLEFFKLERGDTAVLELDVDRCRGQDLLSPKVWQVLMWGAREGRIDLLFGGPPGRSGLIESLQKGSFTATKSMTVIARMLWLHVVATAGRLTRASASNRRRTVGFLLEHPGEDTKRGELWKTNLWRSFEEESAQIRVSFDQQGMGSKCPMPTTVGTNIPYLQALNGIQTGEAHEENDKGEERTSRWAPGLVKAMCVAFHLWQRGPSLMALSEEKWRQHVEANHHPYRRDCLTCVMSRGLGRRHARVCHPDSFTLTSDLTGPLKPGLDPILRGSLTKSMRYLMVARYVFPKEYLKAYGGGVVPGENSVPEPKVSKDIEDVEVPLEQPRDHHREAVPGRKSANTRKVVA